jgi:hypothetical protein
MKEILSAMVQAIGDQAIASGEMAEQIAGLKQTLARQLPQLTDELKAQVTADQEKSRKALYELQVNLAKLREAISELPDAKSEAKEKPPKAPAPA